MISVSDAKDAKLRVDGSDYTRSSNNITDIIDGVTLNLKTVSENGEAEQLTLTNDTSAIKTSCKTSSVNTTRCSSKPPLPASMSRQIPPIWAMKKWRPKTPTTVR